MKSLLAFLVPFAFTSAHAASVTITSNQSTYGDIAQIPQQLISVMVENNIPFVKKPNGIYSITMNKINCSSMSNAPVDSSDPHSGIPKEACRYNTKATLFPSTGKVMADGRYFEEGILKIQDSSFGSGVGFSDCAMGGKCVTYVKSAICTVDTKIEEFLSGRFSCTLTDNQ
ncbi:MAG TPA: hypothetical protein VF412_08530 [Bdellovibrio sp.]|uniref:hypothetical protein n=1 Tax=Bdellovibrio sp. TaxID=28201 RepID=UPI002F0589D0